MHTEMWEHDATRRTIEQLRRDGVHIVGPIEGALAGGDEGAGRMVEPEVIADFVSDLLSGGMAGLRVLVTAGGTREPIDPVRYIGNRSSGKMGHAIADEAARRGAEVVLVTTASLDCHHWIRRIDVETAEEMLAAVSDTQADVVVMAAAVADFRPEHEAAGKISRADGMASIPLMSTPDILASVASRPNRPYLVGFAAETGDLERAKRKATAKGVDLLVANDVTEPGAGFGSETNIVTLIEPGGELQPWPLMTKREVAVRLWDLIGGRIAAG